MSARPFGLKIGVEDELDFKKALSDIILVADINQTLCDKDTFQATLQKNIESVLESEKSLPLTDIDKRLVELQEELLKRTGD